MACTEASWVTSGEANRKSDSSAQNSRPIKFSLGRGLFAESSSIGSCSTWAYLRVSVKFRWERGSGKRARRKSEGKDWCASSTVILIQLPYSYFAHRTQWLSKSFTCFFVSSSVVSFLYKVGAIERLYLLVEVLLFFSFAESNLL